MTQAVEAPATALGEQEYLLPPRQRFNPLRWARREPAGALGIALILIVAFASGAAPILGTTDPQSLEAFTPNVLEGPSGEFLFGTDRQGRDVWSRVLYGARPALMIGIGAVGISIVVATALALTMGYLKGVVDTALSRLIEIIIAIPGLLWLILFTAAFERSVSVIIFAIAFIFSPLTTLVLRGNVIQESASTYAESARDADNALVVKVAMMQALCVKVHICGTKNGLV